MFNSRFKKALVITLVLVMSITSLAVAANQIYTKELTATYGRISFELDGKDITQEIENKYGTPGFIADDNRSYVPVRAIAELMGLEVEYDALTHTAKLTDSKSEEYEAEIKKLNDEIKKLKDEAKKEDKKEDKKEVSKKNLADLQKDLNKEYGEIDDVEFSIRLSESKNKITVYIDIDTQGTSQRNAWRKIRTRTVENMIEDVAEEVYDEFEDYSISGNLYDDYQQKTLYSFKVSTSGKVTVDNYDSYYDDYRNDYRYDDLEYDAERYLEDELGDIKEVSRVYVDIYEDRYGEILGDVELELKSSRSEPSRSTLQSALRIAEDDLRYKYDDDYIEFDIDVYFDDYRYGRYSGGNLKEY